MSQMAKYRLKLQKARKKLSEKSREESGKETVKVKVLDPDTKKAKKLEKAKK